MIPGWKTDAVRIVELIENTLFPLEAAMKEREERKIQPQPTQFAGQTEIIVPAVIFSNMVPEPKPKFSLAALAKEKALVKS